MTLFNKSFVLVSMVLFVVFALFFVLYVGVMKEQVVQDTKAVAKKDIKKYELLLERGANVDEAADVVFIHPPFASIAIDDFLGNELHLLHNSQTRPQGLMTFLTQVDDLVIKEYMRDKDRENISIEAQLDTGYIANMAGQKANNLFSYLAVALLAALVLSFLVLKLLMRPLADIKNQIFHIKENKYMESKKFPKSSDLRQMVVMLNEISSHLKSKLEKDNEMMNKYYEVIYHDDETGLNNRNFFTMHLNSEIDSTNEANRGLVIFVKIVNFDLLNKVYGYKQISTALQSFTKSLEAYNGGEYSVLARIKSDTFAYLISDQDYEKSKKMIAKHYENTLEAINEKLHDDKALIAIAAGEFHKSDSVKSLLSRIDTALNEATIITTGKKIAFAKMGQKALSKEERVKLIDYAFSNDAFNIELRPLQDLHHDRKSFLKLIVFLKDEKENIYNKNEFISILYEKGLVAEYDKSVINKVCNRYRLINQPITIMVVVTSEFIQSLDHIRWLGNKLDELKNNSNIKLCFTVKDDVAQNELDEVLQFAKLIYRFGHTLAIGGFTLDKDKLSYLQRLKPRYIIVEQDYLQDLYVEDKSRVKAINFMIKEVESKLVVAYLQDPKSITAMDELDVDYLLSSNYRGEY